MFDPETITTDELDKIFKEIDKEKKEEEEKEERLLTNMGQGNPGGVSAPPGRDTTGQSLGKMAGGAIFNQMAPEIGASLMKSVVPSFLGGTATLASAFPPLLFAAGLGKIFGLFSDGTTNVKDTGMKKVAGMDPKKYAMGTDTVPAMLTPGEAVIPRAVAQDPAYKPMIAGMVNEGRMRQNYQQGTTGAKVPESDVEKIAEAYAQIANKEATSAKNREDSMSTPQAPKEMAMMDIIKEIMGRDRSDFKDYQRSSAMQDLFKYIPDGEQMGSFLVGGPPGPGTMGYDRSSGMNAGMEYKANGGIAGNSRSEEAYNTLARMMGSTDNAMPGGGMSPGAMGGFAPDVAAMNAGAQPAGMLDIIKKMTGQETNAIPNTGAPNTELDPKNELMYLLKNYMGPLSSNTKSKKEMDNEVHEQKLEHNDESHQMKMAALATKVFQGNS